MNSVFHDNEGPGLFLEASPENIVVNVIAYRNKQIAPRYYLMYKSDGNHKLEYKEPKFSNGEGIHLTGSPESKCYNNVCYMNSGAGIRASWTRKVSEYIFDLNQDFTEDLNRQLLPTNLIKEFAENNYPIHNNYTVEVLNVNESWKLIDGNKIQVYYIYKRKANYCVYKEIELDTNNVTIKNNILIDNEETQLVLDTNRNNNSDYNLFYSNYGKPLVFDKNDLKEWNNNGRDVNSLIGDPTFVNELILDFHLRGGSICINNGDPNIDPIAQYDFDNDIRPYGSRTDIGAYEYSLKIIQIISNEIVKLFNKIKIIFRLE